LNNLILEILPHIQSVAKGVTKNTDQQNELVQYTVIECYKYEPKIRLYHENKCIVGWIYFVQKREYVRMKKANIIGETKDIEDTEYSDKLEELKPFLSETERLWIRAYIECDGNYSTIEEKKGITRQMASERIKSIIEKCKTLKHILY